MSYVNLDKVLKTYGDVVAADHIDLAVEEGDFFALLGPSGCGKTTILRLIAGFNTPDTGAISVDGQRIEHVPPEKRNIGMVFQNYALFPHLRVAENIAFGLSVKRTPKKEIRRQVDEMLALVRLEGFEDRYPRQLSGGQQQRVALVRALITKPDLLLLDEPLAALDKQLRTQMQVELRELQKKLGITAIFVTHDQEEAMTLSDRIAVMKDGKIAQIGTPTEVYERPRTKFVSTFLGDSNFFSGQIVEQTGDRIKVSLAPDLVLEARTQAGVELNRETILAVRPEKIFLSAQQPNGFNAVPAKVLHRVYMGTCTNYILQPVVGARISVFSQNETRRPAFSVNDRVYASWKMDSIFLLNE
jgi:spermidine/putrescine ABC transporter ATP-binding subunit